MIPEQFKNFKSYSRYRGYEGENEGYDLLDTYICEVVNGNLICTDTEDDIDFDGNICLVTPKGDVYHIGKVPELESGAGKPSFSFQGNNLVMRYRYFVDESHHHSGVEEVVMPLVITDKMRRDNKIMKTKYYLGKFCHAYYGGSYRNTCAFVCNYKENAISIYGTQKKMSRFSAKVEEYKQVLKLTNSGWVLLPDANGTNGVLDNVLMSDSLKGKLLSCIDAMNASKFVFSVVDYKGGKYGIVDVMDGVVEYYTRSEVMGFVNMMITIGGVHNQCIEPLPKDLVDIWRV